MANNDMHIGFDMDGVLVDHSALKQMIARTFGYTLAVAQTGSDAMKAVVAEGHRHEIQRLLYQDDAYALSASLMPGAPELLGALRDAGIRYTLISRRRDHNLARLLLEKLRLRPDYFDDANTVFVSTPQDKEDTCKRLGVTHYIDDEVGVLGVLASVPHRFLMDAHGVAGNVPWTKVSTLAEFRDTIVKP